MSEHEETTDKPDYSDEDSLFEHYWQYATTLRNWLIAYGAGGLVFVAQHQLLSDEDSRCLALAAAAGFMIGLGLQVALVFINKMVAYGLYRKEKRESERSESDGEFKDRMLHVIAETISRRFGIDVCCDMITMITHMVASIMLVGLLAR